MSSHIFQRSNRSRRLLWRNQHKEYLESIVGNVSENRKPTRRTQSSRTVSTSIRLWDLVAFLPPELALMYLRKALPPGNDYPAALIELTSVCSKWHDFLFSESHLWTKIHVRYSSHDLMAIASLFLHLSAKAPLDLVVWNTPGSHWGDIRSLLLPHIHRIRRLALGDDPPIYDDSQYAGAACVSLALDIIDSLHRLPRLSVLDFGRTLHIDPSQIKTLNLPSEIRVFNSIGVYLQNIGHPNHLFSLFRGRETRDIHQFGPGGLILQPDRPFDEQVVYSRDPHSDSPYCTILSLNSVISYLVDILRLLDSPNTSNRVSSSSPYMIFVNTSLNTCHLCSTQRGSLLGAVGCARSHFGLHPFRCSGCRTCNARRGHASFCTYYVLLNHIGPTTCVICGDQQTERWRHDVAGDSICIGCSGTKSWDHFAGTYDQNSHSAKKRRDSSCDET